MKGAAQRTQPEEAAFHAAWLSFSLRESTFAGNPPVGISTRNEFTLSVTIP